MNNYEQLQTGGPLTSAFRSLSPSILGKRQAQTTPPTLPKPPGLGSLASMAGFGLEDPMLDPFGEMQQEETIYGLRSLLGGM